MPKNLKYQPDQKKHLIISIIKSVIRLYACYLGFVGHIPNAFLVLGIAEVVGVVEELV